MIKFYHKYTVLSIKLDKIISDFLLSLIIYKYANFKELHKKALALKYVT